MREEAAREQMVREQLEAREVHSARVLEVMRRVPRHRFVPEALRDQAYEDRPQPIGNEQTISQPLMVGVMTDLLRLTGTEKVLEIGTGSGYQTAILAELAAEVVSVERHPALAERAKCLLECLGYRTVRIEIGDGSSGFPPAAPYDRILVTAAAPRVPAPLLEQLAPNGRLVIPVGDMEVQTLTIITKDRHGHIGRETCGDCVFVPLIGTHGWNAPPADAGA